MARILVIDDSKFARRRTADLLRSWGYEVLEAGDGQEGIGVIAGQQPDCVLTDLLMPEMDGYAVLERLREMNSPPPTFVLSADIQIASKERCESLGAAGFINKPYDPEELRALLAGALS